MIKLFQFFEKNGKVKIYPKNAAIGGIPVTLPLSVYYIKYGFVKVVASSKHDNEFLELMYGKNDIFPLLALSTFLSGKLKYLAVNRVKVYSLEADFVLDAFKENTGLSSAMMNYMINDAIFIKGLLQDAHYKSAHDKLAYGLVIIAVRFGKIDEQIVSLDKVFNHRLIGEMVNLSRETVTRELGILRSKGLVYILDGQIVIMDMNKLEDELDKSFEPSLMEQFENKQI